MSEDIRSQTIPHSQNLSSLSTQQTTAPQILTVEQVNNYVRSLIENNMGTIWIKGEISNFKPHSSGHFYFSLKDSKAQISAMMFKGYNSKLKFKPHDGLEVIVRGKITVYEPRGTYSLACEMMEPVGAGALQKQFEQLKEKLKSEGLFELSRKKELPAYPKKIAIVTSPTGAAIQDIINIMSRRAKNVEITIVPAIVQGPTAPGSLCEAFLNAEKLKPDVIIIGRGGGSIEDLWCFNDENLARIIAASLIPTISAVGHEIDFTICDFVADLRAPTPSAAAELVSKSSLEVIQKLKQLDRLLAISLQKILQNKKQSLALYARQLIDPKKKLQDLFVRNDELYSRLENAMQNILLSFSKDVRVLESKLVSPEQILKYKKSQVQKFDLKLETALTYKLSKLKFNLKNCISLLDSLSPLKVVDRGYAIATVDKLVVKSVKKINKGDIIKIKVIDGEIESRVESITSSSERV